MLYCRSLAFDDEPDYRYLRGLFDALADEYGGRTRRDLFDWRVRGVYAGGGGGLSPATRAPLVDGDSCEEYPASGNSVEERFR